MEINFNPQNTIKNTQSVAKTQTATEKTIGENTANSAGTPTKQSTKHTASSIETFKLPTMSKTAQAAMLRELLDLPKEWSEFMDVMLKTSPDSAEKLTKALIQQKINPADIKNLLETNSKEAIGKFINLMKQGVTHPQNSELLTSYASKLSSLAQSAASSESHAMKEIILLYLPLAQMTPPQNIEVDSEEKKGGGAESSNSLILYATTISLGRFKITLSTQRANDVYAQIENSGAPKGSESYLKRLDKLISKVLEESKINAQKEFTVSKTPKITTTEKQNFTLRPIGELSHNLVNAAFIIVKLIFDFDEKIIKLNSVSEEKE